VAKVFVRVQLRGGDNAVLAARFLQGIKLLLDLGVQFLDTSEYPLAYLAVLRLDAFAKLGPQWIIGFQGGNLFQQIVRAPQQADDPGVEPEREDFSLDIGVFGHFRGQHSQLDQFLVDPAQLRFKRFEGIRIVGTLGTGCKEQENNQDRHSDFHGWRSTVKKNQRQQW
jgi:hypothetical protein